MMNISPFTTELRINHLSLFLTVDETLDTADPSSMQHACHISTKLTDLVTMILSLAHCIGRPPGI